jgi:hypothetical protein
LIDPYPLRVTRGGAIIGRRALRISQVNPMCDISEPLLPAPLLPEPLLPEPPLFEIMPPKLMLPEALWKYVPDPDPGRWYVFPMLGRRKESYMFHYGKNNGFVIVKRHRQLLKAMVKNLAADQGERRDPKFAGALTDADWAKLIGYQDPKTASKYRREIARKFREVRLNAFAEIFETVDVDGFCGTRVRGDIFIVEE